MGWLSKLFGASAEPSKAAPRDDEDEDLELCEVTESDWLAFEARLADLLEGDLRQFATDHPAETFYSVALDCNAAYCDVLLSANTPDALAASAASSAKDGSDGAIAQESEAMRWGFGDWKYHGFNLCGEEDQERYHSILPGGDELHSPDDCERFLVAACRALLLVEARGAFAALKQTSDFRVACVDHDEDISAGDKRLQLLRASP